MEALPEGTRVARIAAVSDLHYGIDDNAYLTISQIAQQVAVADGLGADVLFLGGDNANRASVPHAQELAKNVVANFRRPIIAIGGNHDSAKTLQALCESGIVVLDGSTTRIEINGARFGIFGQNGSLPFALRESLRGKDWDTVQTPAHDAYTRSHYHPIAEREIRSLMKEGIDVLIVLSHVPLYPEQVTDAVPNPKLGEMTPATMQLLEKLSVRVIAISGHTHSFSNSAYGRENPVATLESGTVIANVGYPNTRRGQRSPITYIDIYQNEDGQLEMRVPKLISALR